MTGNSNSTHDDGSDDSLIIVGIGASAGGLEALRLLVPVVFRGIIFQKGATPCSKHGISLRDYYPNMVME